MKNLILVITSLLFCLSASAQNFFDDRSLDKPVRHMSRYNNDNWTLLGIERTSALTIVKVKYKAPYMNAGWSLHMDLQDCLTDPRTGRRFPLLDSQGIPRDPDSYVFDKVTNDVELTATLLYPPIPSDVRTVDTSYGLYDIDLGSIPVISVGKTRFFDSKTNQKGNLSLSAVNDDGVVTLLYFSYTPAEYGLQLGIEKEASLKDRATGKTYPVKDAIGIPMLPDRMPVPYNSFHENPPVGFILSFPSMSAAGVKSFDFIDGNWSISDISL